MVVETLRCRLDKRASHPASLRGRRLNRASLPAPNEDNLAANQESLGKHQFRCLERRSSTKARMKQPLRAANSTGRDSDKRVHNLISSTCTKQAGRTRQMSPTFQ